MMYNRTVKFRIIGHIAGTDKEQILEMFFKDWVDNTSTNYNVDIHSWHSLDILEVKFENEEDALALRLKGIPEEFRPYIEIAF